MIRVLDLFSGIGAFSLGLQRAGMTPIAFVEIDPFCRDVLARHWPEVTIFDDVRTAEFPSADVICGGFPCQDVSRAGKRAGITGQRSGLYRELVRAFRMVRPRVAIVENVAALIGDGMDVVLGDLAEGGNCVEWDCIPASGIGAPHQRDRVWIVAHTNGVIGRRGAAGEDWAEANHCSEYEASTHTQSSDDWEGHAIATERQKPQPGNDPSEASYSDATSDGCGQGWSRRPPDSFAWVRDATRWHTGHAYREGLSEWEGERGYAQSKQQAFERATLADVWQQEWPREPALLGVDDGIADRLERTKALGNSLIPQIPELIGRAILEAHA